MSKARYTLSCDHRDLFITPIAPTSDAILKLLRDKPPSNPFYDALDYFCQRFYPDIHAEQRPWVMHRRLLALEDAIPKKEEQLKRTRQELPQRVKALHDAFANLEAKSKPRRKTPQITDLTDVTDGPKTTKSPRPPRIAQLKTVIRGLKDTPQSDLLIKTLTEIRNAFAEFENGLQAPKAQNERARFTAAIEELEEITKLDNALEQLKKDKTHCENEVSTKIDAWPLAWYWKALFPGLPALLNALGELDPDSTILIRLSQVRQWVLAIVYKVEGTETPRQQTLLRPPLLGRSDRITLWDQYITLLSLTEARKTIEATWQGIQSARDDSIPGSRLDEELWYVIGRHDLLYTIQPAAINCTASGQIDLEITAEFLVDPHRADAWETKDLEFGNDPVLGLAKPSAPDTTDVEYPYDIVRIPCFQDEHGRGYDARLASDPDDAFLAPECILFASDKVCQAYEQLTEVWNDKTTKSVLIIAPSGSGKELLAKSNHLFQSREGPYVTFALSPSSHERNDHTLFSRDLTSMFTLSIPTRGVGGDPFFDELLNEAKGLLEVHKETRDWCESSAEPKDCDDEGHERPFPWLNDGLIFGARKGTLFLDEIDKVPEQTRASLLRLLENDEFCVYGTPIRLRLKLWRPLYVFAGSLPAEEMLRLPPEDFWNRMIQRVVMEHPLEVDDPLEQQRITRSYFHFFWITLLKEFFKDSQLLPFRYAQTHADTAAFFHRYYLSLFGMLKDRGIVERIATMYAEEVCTASGNPKCSIRSIKVAASRVIYGLVDYFLYGKNRHTWLHRLREHTIEIWGNDNRAGKRDWFDLVGTIIKRAPIEGLEEDEHTELADLGESLRIEVRDIVHHAVERVLD